MKTIRMLTTRGRYREGQLVEVDDARAARWLGDGTAEDPAAAPTPVDEGESEAVAPFRSRRRKGGA